MDRLFTSNVEDKEIMFKSDIETESIRDNPPEAAPYKPLNDVKTCQTDGTL